MPAIQVRGLTKTYWVRGAERAVVSDLSFSVESGKVFGFLGPNGAGKTTTMKILVGLARPSSGTVAVVGKDPHERAVRARMGFMPENPSFYSHLTGREFLGFMASLFGIEREKQVPLIEELLGRVGLSDAGDLPIRKYSKGMGQRLALAQALINDPDVIFLDEPLDGLDPLGRADAKKFLLDLKKKGKTIFFNSHILADVEDVCDMVGIIDRGRLVAQGSVKDVMRSARTLEEAFVTVIRNAREERIA